MKSEDHQAAEVVLVVVVFMLVVDYLLVVELIIMTLDIVAQEFFHLL
jgi:hypothetical protein